MYCRSDHWSSISVSVIQPALRNTASSPIRGSCQPICRILSNSSGGSMIGECRWISTESLWRTSERLERRFRINPWVYFWKILKLLVAFRFWSLSKWDSFIGCLKDQKCETHAGSFLRAICTLFYLQYISSKCLILLQPVGLPMWKSRPSSSSLIMVVRHGGSQMHSVEAVLVRVQEVAKIKKPLLSFENVPAKNNGCQLANSFNSLQWGGSILVMWIIFGCPRFANSKPSQGKGIFLIRDVEKVPVDFSSTFVAQRWDPMGEIHQIHSFKLGWRKNGIN